MVKVSRRTVTLTLKSKDEMNQSSERPAAAEAACQ